jgi:hypothetical protein
VNDAKIPTDASVGTPLIRSSEIFILFGRQIGEGALQLLYDLAWYKGYCGKDTEFGFAGAEGVSRSFGYFD